MKIGLYFGSFNPIHIGHLIIGSFVANNTDVSQVWFVVSPQNPFKKSTTLLNEYHRLHLIQLAINKDERLKASNVEFKLPRPSYTIHSLKYLKEKYPSYEFAIILGSDSYQNINKWKDHDEILANYALYIYKRPNFEIVETALNVTILDAPLLEISSTMIRREIKAGKSIRYLVPDNVQEEIFRNNYYSTNL